MQNTFQGKAVLQDTCILCHFAPIKLAYIYFKMLGIFMLYIFSLLSLGVPFPVRLFSATLLCLWTDTRVLSKAPVHLEEVY